MSWTTFLFLTGKVSLFVRPVFVVNNHGHLFTTFSSDMFFM